MSCFSSSCCGLGTESGGWRQTENGSVRHAFGRRGGVPRRPGRDHDRAARPRQGDRRRSVCPDRAPRRSATRGIRRDPAHCVRDLARGGAWCRLMQPPPRCGTPRRTSHNGRTTSHTPRHHGPGFLGALVFFVGPAVGWAGFILLWYILISAGVAKEHYLPSHEVVQALVEGLFPAVTSGGMSCPVCVVHRWVSVSASSSA